MTQKAEKKTRQSNPLPTEPRARFVALVERRVTSALAGNENVGKIARSKPIKYTADDVEVIRVALQESVDAAISALEAGLKTASDKPVKQVFTLPKA